jgi:hypothetical protein
MRQWQAFAGRPLRGQWPPGKPLRAPSRALPLLDERGDAGIEGRGEPHDLALQMVDLGRPARFEVVPLLGLMTSLSALAAMLGSPCC